MAEYFDTYSNDISEMKVSNTPGYCKCIHCGKVYENYKKPERAIAQLHGHLGGCKKRMLLKHVKFQSVIIVLTLNPKRRTMATLHEYIKKKSRNVDNILGILGFLKQRKELKKFSATEIKDSPNFLQLPDGVKSYVRISNALSKPEKESFRVYCNELFAHRHDPVEGDTT